MSMEIDDCGIYDADYYFPAPTETRWNEWLVTPYSECEFKADNYIYSQQLESGFTKDRNIHLITGAVGGSAKGKTESDGASSAKADIYVEINKDRTTMSASVGGEIKRDPDGKVSTAAEAKVEYKREF